MEPIEIQPGTREENRVRMTFRVGAELRDRIHRHATRNKLTLNDLFIQVMKETLDQLDRQEKEGAS
jgi:predicted HicB family RNase H-like nuclease